MSRISFTTAGESHGPALTAIVEGIPAGLPLSAADVDTELARRQKGYGRGRRMQIETDVIELLSGVRAGQTLGSPISMVIRNKDWEKWTEIMDPASRPEDTAEGRKRKLTRVRPGHADLSGILKYDREDARDILERASARETTARVAAGAIAKRLLAEFGVTIGSHVISLGGIEAAPPSELPADLNAAADPSPLRTLDKGAEVRMIELIDKLKKDGNTAGGIAEVVVRGLPVGLGSHVSWDRKLDGRLARAILSIHAVKGMEFGSAFDNARKPGDQVHDEIVPAPGGAHARSGNVRRKTNRAGGLEGGITNGEALVIRAAMKPISTLMSPLATIDSATGLPAEAAAERSDVTAVPAMAVIAESMTALVLADALAEKFGGDSLGEMQRNFNAYLSHIASRISR
jgi:chorismate synthase